jgi:hypothetical protein
MVVGKGDCKSIEVVPVTPSFTAYLVRQGISRFGQQKKFLEWSFCDYQPVKSYQYNPYRHST